MVLDITCLFLLQLHHFAIYTLLVVFLYIVLHAIYQLFFSPLKGIPGPWHVAISDFGATTNGLCMQQCKSVHALFDMYGNVVQIGPNKVVFQDLDSMRSMYSVLKFNKSKYYRFFFLYALIISLQFPFTYTLYRNDSDHT